MILRIPSYSTQIDISSTHAKFIRTNDLLSDQMHKTYTLQIDIPKSAPGMAPLVEYFHLNSAYITNKINALLCSDTIEIPCIITLEKDSMYTVSMSIEYADIPMDILSSKIKDMGLGTYSSTEQISTWAEKALDHTDGLVVFPTVYSPKFFEMFYDKAFLGDTNSVNAGSYPRNGRYQYISLSQDGDYTNGNAMIPTFYLPALLKRIFERSGYTYTDAHMPWWWESVGISTLAYPDKRTSWQKSLYFPGRTDGESRGIWAAMYEYVFFSHTFQIPTVRSAGEIKLKLFSGDLYPFYDTVRQGYVYTVYRLRVYIEGYIYYVDYDINEVTNIDIKEIVLTCYHNDFLLRSIDNVFSTKKRGYLNVKVEFLTQNFKPVDGKNEVLPREYYDMSSGRYRVPYVVDLAAEPSVEYAKNCTYEIFYLPDETPALNDKNMFVFDVADYIGFDTVKDLLLAIKNMFGIQFTADHFSRTISPVLPQVDNKYTDLDAYTPSAYSRTYRLEDIRKPTKLIYKSANGSQKIFVVTSSGDQQEFRDAKEYDSAKIDTTNSIELTSDLSPLTGRKGLAFLDKESSGKPNIFFILKDPLHKYIPTSSDRLKVDDKTFYLSTEEIFPLFIKPNIVRYITSEQIELTTLLSTNTFLSMSINKPVKILNQLYDVVSIEAEETSEGLIVTIILT